jgi:ATP-dependent protease ClpP protease subunit
MALERQRMRLIDRLMNIDSELATKIANVRLPWYTVRNAVDADTTEILIYEEIGFWGIAADEFVAELNKISTKNIKLRLNSPGGGVFDSIAIYNALVAHDANVHVQVDALAASGASIIAMSGDTITMMVGSQMMIHDALGIEIGNAKAMREMAKFLDAQSNNIATVYAAKAGGDTKDWRALMLAETWLMAEEAVDAGLADEVYSRPEPASEDDTPEETDPPEEEPEDETEPDGDEPEEGEEEPEDDEEESIDDMIDNLMKIPHDPKKLKNRYGYKHGSRNTAPAPMISLTHKNWVDELIDNMEGK